MSCKAERQLGSKIARPGRRKHGVFCCSFQSVIKLLGLYVCSNIALEVSNFHVKVIQMQRHIPKGKGELYQVLTQGHILKEGAIYSQTNIKEQTM